MGMKTIYLHIGRGKTGTTAQQQFLSKNRATLLANGIDYLLAGDNGRGGGHQQFAKSFITDIPDYMIPAKDPESIRTATAAEICASPAQTILMSSENFPLVNLDVLRDWLDALPVPNQIKVIFFARWQDELAESEYNQMVKLKRETRKFADFAAALEGADYDAECAAWSARFGAENVIARLYDAVAQDAITKLLCCLPGGETLASILNIDSATTSFANRSLGARALLLAWVLNTVEMDNRDAFYRTIFAKFEGNDLPAVLMNAEQAETMRARFAQSNTRFCTTYLKGSQQCQPEEMLGRRRYDNDTRDRHYNALKALKISH